MLVLVETSFFFILLPAQTACSLKSGLITVILFLFWRNIQKLSIGSTEHHFHGSGTILGKLHVS
jgi:hypothetical protein